MSGNFSVPKQVTVYKCIVHVFFSFHAFITKIIGDWLNRASPLRVSDDPLHFDQSLVSTFLSVSMLMEHMLIEVAQLSNLPRVHQL